MPRYGFTSPGADANVEIQKFLIQRALQERDAQEIALREQAAEGERKQRAAELELRTGQERRIADQQARGLAEAERERRSERAANVADYSAPDDAVDAATRGLLDEFGLSGAYRKVPGIVVQGAFKGNDANDIPQYDVTSQPDSFQMRGGSKYLAAHPAPKRTAVKTKDTQGHPIERAFTDEELAGGVPLYEEPEPANWQPLQDSGVMVNTRTGQTRPLAPGIVARPKDNPLLPRGVEDYLASMKRRGYSRQQAETELAGSWDQLRRDHPNLSPLHVQDAVRKLFPDDDFGGASGVSTPPASGGARGTGAGRTATAADVAKVAEQLGISTAEAQKQLEARGVAIR